MNKKQIIMIPNGRDQLKMFREVGNGKYFDKKEKEVHSILADGGGGVTQKAMSKSNTVIVETNAKQQLDLLLKRFNPTAQKSFVYLCNYAIQNNYATIFDVDINELLEVVGMIRRTNNIERLYEDLRIFTFANFQCETSIFNKGKNGERKGLKDLLISQGSLLAWVELKKSGRKNSSIKVEMGRWFEHFKQARQNNDVELLTLPMECLRVDTHLFPYAFGCPYRMAQHARINEKRKSDWHVLSFKEVIGGVEPWEETEKKIKKRGFNDKEKRSLIDRFTLSMEHAEKPFGLNWEWESQEPQTLREATQAKIRFRFLQPLKKIVEH